MTYDASTGTLAGSWLAERKIIYKGGWFTKGAIADDDTLVFGSDVAGPWMLPAGAVSDTEVVNLFRPGENYDLSPEQYLETGTLDVDICATDSDIIYFILGGWLFKTVDGAATVTKTSLPQFTWGSNDTCRMVGKILAVDPINGDHVLVGTPAGLKRTTDGGANWTTISTGTVPAPSTAGGIPRRHCIAFDRSSGATSGRTTTARCLVPGSGLHSSTNGGSTWGAAASGTSGFMPAHMAINGSTGRIHLSGFSDAVETGTPADSQYRYSDDTTTWTAPSGIIGKVVVISPHNAGHHYLITAGGGYRFSSDSGASWGALSTSAYNAATAKWIAQSDAGNFKSVGAAFFARMTNRIWSFDGVSPWYVDSPPTNSSTITWTDAGNRAENMIVGLIDIFDDGLRGYGIHDRCGMIVEPDQIGISAPLRPALTGQFCHGGNVAQPPGSPDFLTMCNFWDENDARNQGGWSDDRGATWQSFAGSIITALGGYGGGNIVSLSETVHIQRQTSNGKIGWTKDNGATWANLVIGNGNATRGHAIYYANHRVLVRDKYVPNRAYLYMCDDNSWGDATAPTEADLIACRGIWRIDYNPATEAMAVNNVRPTWIIGVNDYNHGQLVQYGPNDWLWFAGEGSTGIYRSTDTMVTWSNMAFSGDGYTSTTFGTVFSAAVGKPVADGMPNALLVFGWRDPARISTGDYSSYGAWLSIDGGATLKRVEQWPGQTHQPQRAAGGDPTVFGSFDLGGSEGALNLRFKDVRRGR